MPDLTIKNNLDETIHVAFFLAAPAHWKNDLEPGESHTFPLMSIPYHFQVRRGNGQFSIDDSFSMIGVAAGAWTAGTAAVLTAGTFGGIGSVAAGPMMQGAIAGGRAYATWAADVEVCSARIWVPWFDHETHSIRQDGHGGAYVWNDSKGCRD